MGGRAVEGIGARAGIGTLDHAKGAARVVAGAKRVLSATVGVEAAVVAFKY